MGILTPEYFVVILIINNTARLIKIFIKIIFKGFLLNKVKIIIKKAETLNKIIILIFKFSKLITIIKYEKFKWIITKADYLGDNRLYNKF